MRPAREQEPGIARRGRIEQRQRRRKPAARLEPFAARQEHAGMLGPRPRRAVEQCGRAVEIARGGLGLRPAEIDLQRIRRQGRRFPIGRAGLLSRPCAFRPQAMFASSAGSAVLKG